MVHPGGKTITRIQLAQHIMCCLAKQSKNSLNIQLQVSSKHTCNHPSSTLISYETSGGLR